MIKHTCFRHRSLENCKSGNLNFSHCSLITSYVNLGNLLNWICALGSLSEKHDSYHLPCVHHMEGVHQGCSYETLCETHFDYYGKLLKCRVYNLSIPLSKEIS